MTKIKVRFKVKKITWGHTKTCKLNNDTDSYSLLRVVTDDYVIIVFRENFHFFKDIIVGSKYLAEIEKFNNEIHKFCRIIQADPKYILAKQEFEKKNFGTAVEYFKEYFSNVKIDISNFEFYAPDFSWYLRALVNYYNFDLSSTNPHYDKIKDILKKESSYKSFMYWPEYPYNYISHPLSFDLFDRNNNESSTEELLRNDPEYLFAMVVDIPDVILCEFFFVYGDYNKIPNFLLALELNCLKHQIITQNHLRFTTSNNDDYYDETNILDAFGGDIDACNDHFL